MNAKNRTRVVVAALIVAMLAGAYVIVAKNGPAKGAKQEIPSGFMH